MKKKKLKKEIKRLNEEGDSLYQCVKSISKEKSQLRGQLNAKEEVIEHYRKKCTLLEECVQDLKSAISTKNEVVNMCKGLLDNGMFSESELVGFGNYLLSEFRKRLIEDHPDSHKLPPPCCRLSKVTHADIANWMDWNTGELLVQELEK